MRYLSVCSGIEAATVAWHSLGWEPVAFSEIGPFPCSVLAHHYPGVPNWGDMTKYEEWPDVTVDLLVGGTPCQSFSVAGKRGGMDDIRGQLALAYAGIARKYRPRWLLWENVPGVLSSGGGRDFALFLHTLAELGYGLAYRVLDAQYVRVDSHPRAVPQRRRRVFVVGHLGDWRRAGAVLFEPASLLGNSPPSRKARQEVAGTLASRTSAGGGLGTDFDLSGGVQVYQTLTACGGNTGGRIDKIPHVPVVGNTLTQRMHKGVNSTLDEGQTLVLMDQGGSVMNTLTDGTVGTLRRETHGHEPVIAFKTEASMEFPGRDEPGYTAPTLQATNSLSVAIGTDLYNGAVTGDAAATMGTPGSSVNASGPTVMSIAPSLTASNDPSRSPQSSEITQQVAAVHQAILQVRRLTPRECERLQGFPDDYTLVPHRGKPAADGPRYKALGNSMAVNCMRWIGQRIAAVDAMAASDPGSYDS